MSTQNDGFEARFARFKILLDDPEATFRGAEMRDDLLALISELPDRAAEARLFRELAILEAKRDELSCLDHADRALAADAEVGVLSAEQLYVMHNLCGEVSATLRGGPRTRLHLDRALALAAELGGSVEETLDIRYNIGNYEHSQRRFALALEWLEPLLADAESHHGGLTWRLRSVLGLIWHSQECLGRMDLALAHAARASTIIDDPDPGRRVSGLVAYAGLLKRAGRLNEAAQVLDDACSWAEANCSPATQRFAKDEREELLG